MTDADRPPATGLRVTAIRPGPRAARHQHLACRGCGAVADVPCGTVRPPCLEPAAAAGFAIEEAEVTFWGLCPRCRRSAAR